jgi:hypothetical protein
MGDLLDSAISQLIGELIMVTPPFPPPVDFVSEPICILVNIIKGGQLEKTPVLGTILSVFRYGVIITIMTILLIHWVWKYIGPKWWHFIEFHIKIDMDKPSWPPPPPQPPRRQPPPPPPACGTWSLGCKLNKGYDDVKDDVKDFGKKVVGQVEGDLAEGVNALTGGSIDSVKQGIEHVIYIFKLLLWYIMAGIPNALFTFLLQIPVDLLRGDWERLSFDFDTDWIDKSVLRGDCSRFEDTKNKYAADYSLYENETVAQFHDKILNKSYIPKYIPPSKRNETGYLCNHGTNCPETGDLFGEIGYFYAGADIELKTDNDDDNKFQFITDLLTPSPPSGNLNAIELSSAPRKYYVCCTNGDKSGCNPDSTQKAKMAIQKLQLEVLKNEIEKYELTYGLDIDLAIKKTPWDNTTFSKSSYLNSFKQEIGEQMQLSDGTDCSSEKLSDSGLEKCFGNFKPATSTDLPFIIKNYLKDLFGNLIIYLIILYIIFVILYILCLLFSVAGKEAWVLNKEVGIANDVI